MQNETSLNLLITAYNDVRSLLLKAGLKMGKVAYSRRRLEAAPESRIKEAIIYLEALKKVRGEPFRIAYIQRTPEQWAQYPAMGMEQLNEYRLLRRRAKELIDDWKIRPEILRKDDVLDPTPKGKHHDRKKAKKK